MKKVILLRHAKSSWDDPELPDHDRPLNERGRKAGKVIGTWLKERKHRPDAVLCSSAERARQTLKRLGKTLGPLPEPSVERGLYHAAPARLRDRLRKLDEACGTVLLIGHQPGLGSLSRKLSNGDVRPRCSRAFEHFPTAAAAVLEFDIDRWDELAYGGGRFVDFAVPRELMR